jgi:hypothetical protein
MMKCTICALPGATKKKIETRRRSGDSPEILAREFGISTDALYRHMKNHAGKAPRKSGSMKDKGRQAGAPKSASDKTTKKTTKGARAPQGKVEPGRPHADPPERPGSSLMRPRTENPDPEAFNLRERFPMPNTRDEILLRAQVDDIRIRGDAWLKNPNLGALAPQIQALMNKTRRIYGELMQGSGSAETKPERGHA